MEPPGYPGRELAFIVPFRTVVFPLTVIVPAAPAVMLCVLN